MKVKPFAALACALVASGAWCATEFFADAVNGNDSSDGLAAVYDGTLVVTVNGTTTRYTSADGAQRLRFDSDLARNALSFEYVPGTDDDGGAELDGFRRLVGLSVIVR